MAPKATPADDDPLVRALRAEHGAAIGAARHFAGELTIVIERTAIAAVAATLRDAHGFRYLIDVCGADYPQRTPRFEVIYHLHAFPAHQRLRLKLAVDESDRADATACSARQLPCARFRLYGSLLRPPDLTRIPPGRFNGHPCARLPVEGITPAPRSTPIATARNRRWPAEPGGCEGRRHHGDEAAMLTPFDDAPPSP